MVNPYSPSTPEHFEYEVWDRGRAGGGGERDFLRAFHSPQGVTDLRTCIQAATGAATQVTSMWIDRYPIVRPKPPSTPEPRELADLAIVVRAIGQNGSFRERMLLLQGKIDSANWRTTGSSPKEIDFLEKIPDFDMYTSSQAGAAKLGFFSLKSEFPPLPYPYIPFWAYLMFVPAGQPAPPASPSHAYAAWPSSAMQTTEPLFACVVEQAKHCLGITLPGINANPSLPPRGADVDSNTACTEWRKLYLTLFAHVSSKLSAKLPGGAWMNFMDYRGPYSYQEPYVASSEGRFGLQRSGPDVPQFFGVPKGSANSWWRGVDHDYSDISRLGLADEHAASEVARSTSALQDDGGSNSASFHYELDQGPGFTMIIIDVVANAEGEAGL